MKKAMHIKRKGNHVVALCRGEMRIIYHALDERGATKSRDDRWLQRFENNNSVAELLK